MRRNNIRRHIVSRMLHRRKGIDIFPERQDDDPSRMLSRTSPYSCTSGNDPVDFARSFARSLLFKISFHIAESCFFRQRADRPRPISLSRSKNNFRILMSLALVFTGKIKVNIRLLVPFKSQKGFKRDIKAIFFQRSATDRTLLIRHIASGSSRICLHFRGIKIAVMAFFAIIMGT